MKDPTDPTGSAVSRLQLARREQRAQPAPHLADEAAALAVQAGLAAALGWFVDGPARHWKSGGPSRSAALAHAPLPPAGVWRSPAVAGAWPFLLRGIEAEVALRLREPVDATRAAGLSLADARVLVDAQCVAIEVVDSRWAEGLQAPALAKQADQMCHGALVLGEWLPFDPLHDWATQGGSVAITGQPTQRFQGSHPLGDPAWLLPAWLRHATRGGVVLPAGSVVTTGSWCGLPMAAAGDEVVVSFDGLGETRLQL